MGRYYLCVNCKENKHDECFGKTGEPETTGEGICDDCIVDAKDIIVKQCKDIEALKVKNVELHDEITRLENIIEGLQGKLSQVYEMNIVYGLFRRSYDYYEWDDFIAASTSKDKLAEHHSGIGDDLPLIEEIEHENYKSEESPHYSIIEITIL